MLLYVVLVSVTVKVVGLDWVFSAALTAKTFRVLPLAAALRT
jgi:hypothetical protein